MGRIDFEYQYFKKELVKRLITRGILLAVLSVVFIGVGGLSPVLIWSVRLVTGFLLLSTGYNFIATIYLFKQGKKNMSLTFSNTGIRGYNSYGMLLSIPKEKVNKVTLTDKGDHTVLFIAARFKSGVHKYTYYITQESAVRLEKQLRQTWRGVNVKEDNVFTLTFTKG